MPRLQTAAVAHALYATAAKGFYEVAGRQRLYETNDFRLLDTNEVCCCDDESKTDIDVVRGILEINSLLQHDLICTTELFISYLQEIATL